MNLDVPVSDERRIEVVVNGLPLWHGSQLALDATIVSPLTRRGEAHPRADVQPSCAVAAEARRKRTQTYTYPELDRARRCRLVVVGVEVPDGRRIAAVPVLKKRGGILLAIPLLALTEEGLAQKAIAGVTDDLGPTETCPARGVPPDDLEEGHDMETEVILLDWPSSGNQRLAGPKVLRCSRHKRSWEPRLLHVQLAEEEGEGEDNLSTDNLLKMALVKLLQTGPGSKASKKKQALGVASLDSSSEEEDGLAKLSGAKGTVLGEKLKAAMKKNPEAYSDAILKLAAESVGSEVFRIEDLEQFVKEEMPVFRIEDLEQFVKEEMPVGTQKTLGYSTWNLLHIYKFLHAGQVEKAKLQVLLGVAATEQFLLDQNWGSGERLLHIPKPPFQTWRASEGYINSLRGELSHSRLIPPTWAASIIARLRDEEVLVRRRGKFKGTGKGKDEKGTEKE
eukprot:s5083_g7.t1